MTIKTKARERMRKTTPEKPDETLETKESDRNQKKAKKVR
jgi:hypothetical protein